MLEYDEWYSENEEEMNIEFAETGADREYDYDPEQMFEDRYDEYCDVKDNINNVLEKCQRRN